MRIEIRLCHSLAQRSRLGLAFAVTVKTGATVADVWTRLHLPAGALRLALCNGRSLLDEAGCLDRGHPLADGDHLVFGSGDDSPQLERREGAGLVRLLGGLFSPIALSR